MRKGIWIILLGVLLAAGILSDSYPKSWQSDSVNTSVQVTAPFQPQYTPNKNAQSSVNLAAELCGLSQFQKQYGTTGNKQRIALIDSGIDLGHVVFQTEEKEQPKVVIYRDYTEEGRLETQAAERYRNMLSAGGSVYRIGNIPNDVETYRLAFLDLNTVSLDFLQEKTKRWQFL